jgi:hypothetical protein
LSEPEDLPGAASNQKLSEEKPGMHRHTVDLQATQACFLIISFSEAEFFTKQTHTK